ncbi:metallophosphoesterase [Desulfuribacillus alkaliarsenatis]|uniref:Calcineurin-like phosphoesterase domain-containing protein n=1 Tax=Desulfuribacillus alkaliarsenatis TaxID=766136 RepID=A0A1E5G134_9FIRM|nr:metallophosphoesterase [Desulfuribacillus alkaliarsenatis]OEF96622.1 hypothetical protein BHF68_08240 [Desulfuribacillus alkaliarsenatis]
MFIIILLIVLGINIAWYLLSDKWLRTDLEKFPKARRYTRIALSIWIGIIFIPLLSASLGLGNPLESGPWAWISILYLWIGTILFWMIGLAVVGIPIWGVEQLLIYFRNREAKGTHDEKEHDKKEHNASKQEDESVDSPRLNRRQLVKLGLVATPPLLVSGGTVAAVIGKRNLNVRTIDLPVRNLPQNLEGFTITQLSDTHIGMLTGRERVENIVETANSFNSNITVVTGDILDNNFDYMPDLVDTMSQLKAEQGVYLCIGNHDKMYDPSNWVRTVRKSGLNLLLDESTIIDTGGTPIKLLGIDFSNQLSQDIRNIRTADEDTRTPENSMKILLAHHPHAFDAAVQADIPTTLAGHTHGGQIVLKIGEKYELFNPGNYLFRYVDGIYRKEDGSSLFVHRGSGDWFPLRTGVPAEVVQLRLVTENIG